jgi:uracil-DNA glycosylase
MAEDDDRLPEPYAAMVRDHPGPEAYPPDDFRHDFGPVFHRGRLDGSARVLVVGEAPGEAESSARRVFVGDAGRVVQGLLAKLGVDRSYVMLNCFLYGVAGDDAAQRHAHNRVIARYRHRWLNALLLGSQVEAVIGIGPLADAAFEAWHETDAGSEADLGYVPLPRPPGSDTGAARAALAEWNQGLDQLYAVIQHPDDDRKLSFYDERLRPEDLAPIPAADLPETPRGGFEPPT